MSKACNVHSEPRAKNLNLAQTNGFNILCFTQDDKTKYFNHLYLRNLKE